MSAPLFHTGHYNILAARIKDRYDSHGSRDIDPYRYSNNTLDELVLSLCERFKEDNPLFDANRFIEAAVPDWRLKKVTDDYAHME